MKESHQLSLFPLEPPLMAGSPELKFELIPADSKTVSVEYERRFMSNQAHFEFRGDNISSTGYYSFFPMMGFGVNESDEEIVEIARKIAESLRQERLDEIGAEARRTKKKRNKSSTGQ
jgi:hypothetical protein